MKAKEKTNLTGKKVILVKLTRVDLLLVNLLNHKKCDLVHVTNKQNKAGGKNTEGNRHRIINMRQPIEMHINLLAN